MAKAKNKNFWEKEYQRPVHLALSTKPAEDLQKFMKWAERNAEWPPFPKMGFALDLGCGNGRNIVYLCKETGMKGLGIDISSNAIEQAKKSAKEAGFGAQTKVEFRVGEINSALDVPDGSCDVVLDMMTSHFLDKKGRTALSEEIARVMKPYGWFLFKTFIIDEDSHAKRLLREHPADEPGSYIHPKIGVAEHVYTSDEIHELFGENFNIHKMLKSYKHVLDGKPHKRRTVSVYMERKRN